MIRAELHSLDSTITPDMDISDYVPEDPESFGFEVTASIGAPGEPGEDLFYFFVCTPRWLMDHPAEKGFLFARDYVLMWRWDYHLFVRAISDLCSRAEGPDWVSVATQLSRYGHWEFEDYRP